VTADSIQRLVDDHAVRQLMLHYAHGVDRRDWMMVQQCFAPEATIAGTRFSGRRDEYLEQLRPGVESFPVTMHMVGNQLVELDGDRAHTETYLIARHFSDQKGQREALTLGVRYIDDVARVDGSWVITHRVVEQVWSRTPRHGAEI
jgi:hypothetical protein